MKNLFSLVLSLILLATTVGTACLLLFLSRDVVIERVDPGMAPELRVP